MRRAPEPRGTLKPLWNIIPDGTITDYTPTTISIDTKQKKHTNPKKRFSYSNRNIPKTHTNTRKQTTTNTDRNTIEIKRKYVNSV